ncbi:putative amiloride-sensitive sodium channel, partial [Operophtera brumata]
MNGISPNEMFQNTEKEILSLNSNSIRGWSMETGYSDLEKDPFPKRGNENHASPDLEIFLRSREIDRDPLCNGLKSGFEIYLHHPADYPQSSLYHYSAVNGEVTTLAVSLHAQSTSDSLARYSPDVRQCYFQSDRYLRYFKNYTTKNCKAECLSNYTQEHCGCVGFYMPHDNSSLFCAESKLDCMRQAFDKMVRKEQRLKLGLDFPVSGCRCLPACNSVEYDADVLRTAFVIENFAGKRRHRYYGTCNDCYSGYFDFEDEYNISKVEIYFKKSRFMSFHRSELFGPTDFLASIGGILDLFLGFSFLSLVEILYFITLRLGVAIRRDIVEEKKKRAAAECSLRVALQLNHSELLRTLLLACGVSTDKHADIYPVLVDVSLGESPDFCVSHAPPSASILLRTLLLACGVSTDKHADIYPVLVDVSLGESPDSCVSHAPPSASILLRSLLLACGVSTDKHADIYPVLVDVSLGRITNLQLQTHLTSLCITNRDISNLLRLMELDVPVHEIKELVTPLVKQAKWGKRLTHAAHQLETVYRNAKALGCACPITVAPFLASNATQHSGVFWQMYVVRDTDKPKAKHRSGDLIARGG